MFKGGSPSVIRIREKLFFPWNFKWTVLGAQKELWAEIWAAFWSFAEFWKSELDFWKSDVDLQKIGLLDSQLHLNRSQSSSEGVVRADFCTENHLNDTLRECYQISEILHGSFRFWSLKIIKLTNSIMFQFWKFHFFSKKNKH